MWKTFLPTQVNTHVGSRHRVKGPEVAVIAFSHFCWPHVRTKVRPSGFYRQNLSTIMNLRIIFTVFTVVFTVVIYYFKDSTSAHYSIPFFSSNLQFVVEPARRVDDVSYRPSPIPSAASATTCRRSEVLVTSIGSIDSSPTLPLPGLLPFFFKASFDVSGSYRSRTWQLKEMMKGHHERLKIHELSRYIPTAFGGLCIGNSRKIRISRNHFGRSSRTDAVSWRASF